MSRRPIRLEDWLGARTSATCEGAEALVRDLRGRRASQDEGDDASADTRDPDAFSRAVRERADARRLGWDELHRDGRDGAA